MSKTRLIFLLLIIFFNTYVNYAQLRNEKYEELIREFREYIQKEMKNNHVVGLGIALVDDQEVVWTEGFGYADKKNNVTATPYTVFRVGSVSKLFTSMAVMQLAENKLLNIDEPVNNYLPEFSIKTRFTGKGEITARNIMTHHSGLPSDIFNGFFSDEPKPFTSIIEYLNNEYTCSPPDFYFSYSNPGYTLLGCLVERISGSSFIDYTDNHIFKPLGMMNSSFELSDSMNKLYSKGYAKGNEYIEPYLRDLPAGLLYSNVTDLANFIKMTFNKGVFNGNPVILEETLTEMQSRQNGNIKLDFNFKIGLCWFLSDNNEDWDYAGGIAEHGGDTYVYHASLKTLPKQKLGVVVLTNTDNGARIAAKIARFVLKRTLEEIKKITAPKQNENSTAGTKIKYYPAKKKYLEKFEGDYLVGTIPLKIKAKSNKLVSKYENFKIILKLKDTAVFIPKLKYFGVIPFPMKKQMIKFMDINGMNPVILFIENNRDSSVAGIKIIKNEISQTWKNRIGKYYIMNDQSDYKLINDLELYLNNGFLIIKGKDFTGSTIRMLINPVNENEAVVEGIGRSTGYTITFDGNKMFFSGLKMKKIKELN